MASSLPDNPSLERIKRDARRLQRAVDAGDPSASAIVRRSHPRAAAVLEADADRFALYDAQLTIARGFGFSGWPALTRFLDAAAELSVDPSSVAEDALPPADLFCARASLRYDDSDAPPRRESAARVLAAEPGLVDHHVWAAASASDPAALRRHLASDPTLVSRPGGPFGWVPLLYLCYSRLPSDLSRDETLDAATLLLDAGADPNAGYLWRGMATPFTALTGVLGEGEQGPRRQPRHPFDHDLARLLLERGADAEDQQALYNRMFRRGDDHLELLFAYGLGTRSPGPWPRRLGEAMESRAEMWERQVDWAAEHGFTERLDLLARHGVEVSGANTSAPVALNALDADGQTLLHRAAWEGDTEAIRALLAAGADPTVVDRRFQSTPLGWAEHAYQTEAADLLRAVTDEIGRPPA